MHQESIQFTTLARRTDPGTSIAAGRKAEREGTVARHERLIIECLTKHGPCTAKEMQAHMMDENLDWADKLTSIEISRRSGGLIHTKPYRCHYNGTRKGFKVWAIGAAL